MGRKLRKLLAFSFTDWLMLLRIYALFLLMELGFRFLRFSTIVRLISMKRNESRSIAKTCPQRELYLVTLASRYTVLRVTCLKKSFVLFCLLRRNGKFPVLHIGVQKDENFEAHAWVEVAGSPVLDARTRISAFRQIFQLA